ncbi:hypothetical protein [Nocardiopsis halophila]|uniref:hypothetical protein n=1 Tax=Nocardiopsis halophila TaxID=141692 RepID=UPI0003473AF3|nr:hypothetical protein [Nocardiopsis halophila]
MSRTTTGDHVQALIVAVLMSGIAVVTAPGIPMTWRHANEHFAAAWGDGGVPGTLELTGRPVTEGERFGTEQVGPCQGTFTTDGGEVYDDVLAGVPEAGGCAEGTRVDDARLVPRDPSGWLGDDTDEAHSHGEGRWLRKYAFAAFASLIWLVLASPLLFVVLVTAARIVRALFAPVRRG